MKVLLIEDDPGTSGTQYTILRCTSGNADFITNGVRAGDVVRTQYTGDGFGNYTYSEYVVDAVQSEDQLRLVAGPGAAVSVGAKTEVWRNLTATEEAAEVGLSAGSWGNRRVRAVWPDQIESAGTVMEGYHLCASLAALAGGVLPHQGLTNVALTGYSSAARSLRKFNRACPSNTPSLPFEVFEVEVALAEAGRDVLAFVLQQPLGDLPSAVDPPDQVLLGDLHVGEEGLAEGAFARDQLDRPGLDPR